MSNDDEEADDLIRWQVFAGPSLHCEDLDPIEVVLDARLCRALHHADPDAWQGLIEFVESDIRHGGV